MLVSLKRADFLARAAETAATRNIAKLTTSFSIFAPELSSDASLAEAVAKAHKKVQDEYKRSLDLLQCWATIRRQLAEANIKHGISPLLTEDEMLKKVQMIQRTVTGNYKDAEKAEASPHAALAKAKNLREKPDQFAMRDFHVSVRLMSDAEHDEHKVRINQIADQRSALSNELASLNTTHQIELDVITVVTLREAKLLPAAM